MFSSRQWKAWFKSGPTQPETTVLLSSMCRAIQEQITEIIWKVTKQRVTDDTEQEEHSDYRLAEADVKYLLGDSLHSCFGDALGTKQKRSPSSDKIVELLGAEISERVNYRLVLITASEQEKDFLNLATDIVSPTEELVHHIVNILTRCLQKSKIAYVEYLSSPAPDEVTPVQVLEEGWDSDSSSCPSSDSSLSSVTIQTSETSLSSDVSPGNPRKHGTILAVFLASLVEHIGDTAGLVLRIRNFERILAYLMERMAGESISILRDTVKKRIGPIYEELCQEFGSAELLLDALESGNVAFEEAVVRVLQAQMRKSTETTNSFSEKMKRFFGKKSKNVSTYPNEQNRQENTSQSKPMCSTLRRIWSAICEAFCRICCIASDSYYEVQAAYDQNIRPIFMYYAYTSVKVFAF